MHASQIGAPAKIGDPMWRHSSHSAKTGSGGISPKRIPPPSRIESVVRVSVSLKSPRLLGRSGS